MKTEQEQIEEIEKVLKYAVADYKHLKKKGVCYCYAETLVDHGYGDVYEYKAEIERLRQEVRDTDKTARNTIEQYRAKNEELENALKQSEDNYSRAFERLKAQQREIEQLKAENDTNMQYIRMMGIQSHIKTSNERAKQAQIDVLTKLKEKCKFDGHTVAMYKNDIDELIKEVENETV